MLLLQPLYMVDSASSSSRGSATAAAESRQRNVAEHWSGHHHDGLELEKFTLSPSTYVKQAVMLVLDQLTNSIF